MDVEYKMKPIIGGIVKDGPADESDLKAFKSDSSAGPSLTMPPIMGFILYSTSNPKSFNGLFWDSDVGKKSLTRIPIFISSEISGLLNVKLIVPRNY